jgi:drug/metabolite transporter (DMT)-like permease
MSGRTKIAVLNMVLAGLCFALMGVLVKFSSQRLPFLVAVFFRTFIGFLMLLPYVVRQSLLSNIVQHRLLFLRSLFGYLALTLFFYALEKLPLSNAVVLNFSSPVFVVPLSYIFLREKKSKSVFLFVVVAFVGAGLLVAPDFSVIDINAVIGLLSALFAALAYVIVRTLSRTEKSIVIVFFFTAYGSLFALLTIIVAFAFGGFSSVDYKSLVDALLEPVHLSFLCGIGITATLGQVFLTKAYSIERASVVAVFSYLNPLLSYILGLIFFNEHPNISNILGGALVLSGCLGVAFSARESLKQEA